MGVVVVVVVVVVVDVVVVCLVLARYNLLRFSWRWNHLTMTVRYQRVSNFWLVDSEPLFLNGFSNKKTKMLLKPFKNNGSLSTGSTRSW
jgi:hypothetical protein